MRGIFRKVQCDHVRWRCTKIDALAKQIALKMQITPKSSTRLYDAWKLQKHSKLDLKQFKRKKNVGVPFSNLNTKQEIFEPISPHLDKRNLNLIINTVLHLFCIIPQSGICPSFIVALCRWKKVHFARGKVARSRVSGVYRFPQGKQYAAICMFFNNSPLCAARRG